MALYFKDGTSENWLDVISLTTNREKHYTIHEEFVASNTLSLAQSKVQDRWITKAIYSDETIVGFTMYGFSPDNNQYEISQLMIDCAHQNKGYGRVALAMIIEKMWTISNGEDIHLHVDKKNSIGHKLYQSVGFINTEKLVNNDIVFKLSQNS